VRGVLLVLVGLMAVVIVSASTGRSAERPSSKDAAYQPGPAYALTIVYDNYQYTPELATAWGFGCVVDSPEMRILFDTGGDGSLLLRNLAALGIDPASISVVVLSHIHGDHVGGLDEFLRVNPNVTVYVPATFPSRMLAGIRAAGATVIPVSGPTRITASVSTTGPLPGPPPEQSLLVETPAGCVVVTGCAHPGVVRIVSRARQLGHEPIYLVLGGFHLAGASSSALDEVLRGLESQGVQHVAPCHCSGRAIRERLREQYPSWYIESGVGCRIVIPGETP